MIIKGLNGVFSPSALYCEWVCKLVKFLWVFYTMETACVWNNVERNFGKASVKVFDLPTTWLHMKAWISALHWTRCTLLCLTTIQTLLPAAGAQWHHLRIKYRVLTKTGRLGFFCLSIGPSGHTYCLWYRPIAQFLESINTDGNDYYD